MHALPKKEAALSYSRLLAIIGGIRPEIWDVIPRGPQFRVASRVDMVALNPQPLPPHELFLLGAAEMALEVVRPAFAFDSQDERHVGWVIELIDEWCGTPWPKGWPWPWPGPRPNEGHGVPWVSGPHPEPWDIARGRVVGAVIFASMASRLSPGALSDALADGADRLVEAALGG
jgi:hypothetical protein